MQVRQITIDFPEGKISKEKVIELYTLGFAYAEFI